MGVYFPNLCSLLFVSLVGAHIHTRYCSRRRPAHAMLPTLLTDDRKKNALVLQRGALLPTPLIPGYVATVLAMLCWMVALGTTTPPSLPRRPASACISLHLGSFHARIANSSSRSSLFAIAMPFTALISLPPFCC